MIEGGEFVNNLVDSISFEYGDMKITFFGIEDFDRDEDSPDWHRHNYYELHTFDSDLYEYKFNSKKVSFKKGEFVLIPPYVSHNTMGAFGEKTTLPKAVAFTVSKTQSSLHFFEKATVELDKNSLIPLAIPNVSIKEIMLLSDTELYSSFHGICKLQATASKIIYNLFKTIMDDVVFVNDCHENTLVVIDNLINIPKFTLSDIAAAINYSERQVSRIIKQHYGLTLSELRRRIKEDNKGE